MTLPRPGPARTPALVSRTTACVRLTLACLAALAAAPAVAGGSWSGSLALTSDYILRGVSQSYGKPAWQGGLAYRDQAGWYAGVWGSGIEPFPYGKRSVELDAFGGYGWLIDPRWNARVTYTRYAYVFDTRRASYDYDEFALSLGYEDRIAATVSWQPDSIGYSLQGYARARPTWAWELSGRQPVGHGFALTGSAGYYDTTRLYGAGYTAGSAGLTYAQRHLDIAINRFFVNSTVYRLFDDASAEGEWVASVVLRF